MSSEYEPNLEQAETFVLGHKRATFACALVYVLGPVSVVGFFVLSFTGLMGENYTKFYDEDVSFFDKQLDGENDRMYYGILMAISFLLAFFSTLYRDTTRSVRNRLIAADDVEFEELYRKFYGSHFLTISLLSVSWETIYETLWIFIALTDMYGVIFVLVGRFAGVLVMSVAFKERKIHADLMLAAAKGVSSRSSKQVSALKF